MSERKGPLVRMLKGEGVASRVRAGEGILVPKQDRMQIRERLPKVRDNLQGADYQRVIKRVKSIPGGQPGVVRRPRRRRKESPKEVVDRFRRKFPDLDIPDPGPEPQPFEGELEPSIIELAGTTWALKTAEGIAESFGGTPDEQESLMRNLIPAMLASRETWERKTAAGIREFVERSLAEGT